MPWPFDTMSWIPEPLQVSFQHPAKFSWSYIFVPLLVPLCTYLISCVSFKLKLWKGTGSIPTLPYLFPFVAHTGTFARGDETLASALLSNATHGAPVRLKGIGFDFIQLSGAPNIRKVLNSTNYLDWRGITGPLSHYMFGFPWRVSTAIRDDDSGPGPKPHPGSNIPASRRVMRAQALFFADLFSRSSMDEFIRRFVQNLETWCAESDTVGSEWVDMPDLFVFIRDVVFTCAVDSFFGKNMLMLSPDLKRDFWEFDDNILSLTTGFPSWIRPAAHRARGKCTAAMRRWRENAVRESEESPVSDDESWDPAWGLAATRRRNKFFDASEGLYDDDARAASDLSLLWAFGANVIPAAFWYLLETLRDADLFDRARKEINGAVKHGSKTSLPLFDSAKLTNNPLLQSIYAETLRLHVVTLITRSVKQDFSLNGWLFPKNRMVIMPGHVEHMSPDWNSADGKHPYNEFWAERFIASDSRNENPQKSAAFSLDGRQGMWIPFGLGEHICPGRHFAKQEMILNFAVLTSAFDFELSTPPGWRPDNSMDRYGLGTMHPKQKTPFRVRRKVGM